VNEVAQSWRMVVEMGREISAIWDFILVANQESGEVKILTVISSLFGQMGEVSQFQPFRKQRAVTREVCFKRLF